MFIARIVFFRLHESPRYLVHAGRPQEAIESLQLISKFNGEDLDLDLEDIDDSVQPPPALAGSSPAASGQSAAQKNTSTSEALRDSPTSASNYSAIGQPDVTLASHSFGTPLPPSVSTLSNDAAQATPLSEEGPAEAPLRPTPRPRMASGNSRRMSRRVSTASEYIESKSGPVCRMLPRWMRRSALAWIDRVAMVLSPEWFRTTVLVWAAWCSMSLGACGSPLMR